MEDVDGTMIGGTSQEARVRREDETLNGGGARSSAIGVHLCLRTALQVQDSDQCALVGGYCQASTRRIQCELLQTAFRGVFRLLRFPELCVRQVPTDFTQSRRLESHDQVGR